MPHRNPSPEEYLETLKAHAESGDAKSKEIFIQTRLAELAFQEKDHHPDPSMLMMKWTESAWSEVLRHLIDAKEETVLHFLEDPNNDSYRDAVWELMQKQVH